MTRIFCCTLLGLFLAVVSAQAQGRATVNGVVIGPAGMPQANVTVIITNAAGIDRRAVSDAMGQVVFGGLQPGAYRLRTEDDTFAPFTQDLMLAGGQTQAVRIALRPRVPVAAPPTQRATLAGTVIGPDGRPRGNVTVILTNPAGIDRRAVSEATGAYIFGGLQPGTYKLRIEDSGPDAQPFAVDSLPLMPGEQRQFDVRLQQIVIVAPPQTPGGNPARPPQPPSPEQRPSRRTREVATPVPEVTAPGGEFQALPNRWDFQWPTYKRYADDDKQPWVIGSPLDPYNQNRLKADFPVFGSSSLFMNTNLQLNTALNPRQVGAGAATSQFFNNNNFVGSLELFRGDTVFQPKSWAVRGTVVGNINDLTTAGVTKTQQTYGIEEAFVEKRLAVLDTSFDFVSIRGGMQNFNSDFRGYLFVDNQLGVRLFGNARSNRDQYNVAFFSMRDRDQGSQLHSFGNRDQTVVIANYFIQDFATPGYTVMFNVHVNRDNKASTTPRRTSCRPARSRSLRRLPRRRQVGPLVCEPRLLPGVRKGRRQHHRPASSARIRRRRPRWTSARRWRRSKCRATRIGCATAARCSSRPAMTAAIRPRRKASTASPTTRTSPVGSSCSGISRRRRRLDCRSARSCPRSSVCCRTSAAAFWTARTS